MADATPVPALASTADPTPYVPVSWMAVAAMTVAGGFITVLVLLGLSAFFAKKPLVQPELLAFPAIGIVLSFAARRVIRNSEGTRTGENLANTAWWICLIAGLGYAAYLLAIDYSVRRDAKNELVRWVDSIKAGDDASFNYAFLRTREPARRAGINPSDTAIIRGQFREEYIAFEQSDLVRLIRRNPGEQTKFTPGAVKEWMYRPMGIECVYGGVLTCPEGTFEINVPLRGMEASGGAESLGRQWGVTLLPNGYIVPDKRLLTRYGWLVEALEVSGGRYGSQFVANVGTGPIGLAYAYHGMVRPNSNIRYWDTSIQTILPRCAVTGGLGILHPITDDYQAFFRDQFFKLPGGGEPSAELKRQFKIIWDTIGLLPPGGRLRNSPDTNPLVKFTDAGVEVSVPCELPSPGVGGDLSAARARIVVVCNDPALVAELKRLRDEANPGSGTSVPPEDIRQRDFKWRVVRIESDLIKVQAAQGRPGEPPMPPGG
jgi:hypothetical protein